MKIMLITATLTSLIPILIALFMPNYYLGDEQNAVHGVHGVHGYNADVTGGRMGVDGDREGEGDEGEGEGRGRR